MNEDTNARGMAFAALTVLSRFLAMLNEKGIFTEAEIEQVIKDAEVSVAHHDTQTVVAARGNFMIIRDWWKKAPE